MNVGNDHCQSHKGLFSEKINRLLKSVQSRIGVVEINDLRCLKKIITYIVGTCQNLFRIIVFYFLIWSW